MNLPHQTQSPRHADTPEHTVIFGADVEAEDFVKVPRAVLRLGRYYSQAGKELQPRHLLLILALAARKFRDEPLLCYWHELGADLGAKPDTVRKWAYQLKKQKLLKIRRASRKYRALNPEKEHANEFDLSPLIDVVKSAFEQRAAHREWWRTQR
jgi:hypothetical protein